MNSQQATTILEEKTLQKRIQEQKVQSLRNRVAIPFFADLFINAFLYWSGGIYLGVLISLSLAIVLFGLPKLFYQLRWQRQKYSFRIFLPFYALLLFTIAITVGIHSNIHFGFVAIIFTSTTFMTNPRERQWTFWSGIVGIIACLYLFHFTSPLLPYPYPFIGGLCNSIAIAMILYTITIHYRDVKKVQEEKLRQNQAFHHSIIEGAMDAVIIFDEKMKILQWNKQAQQMFGHTEMEAINKNWLLLVTGRQERKKYLQTLKDAKPEQVQNWLNRRMEITGACAAGKSIPIEITVIATPYQERAVYTAFLRDVTPIRAAEADLREMNMELQRFASMASHDMKEPLRTISSFSKLLERKVKNTPTTQEYLHFIRDAAQRMNTLLEDLINYARAGKETQATKSIDLNHILIFVKNNLHNLIERQQAIIEADELPTVEGHQTPYLQLFQNIISNGIKYQSEGTQPQINIRHHETDTQHIISISDNGIGMSEEYLDKIFEPFTRLHSRQDYEGTGIGLAICRRIATRYGGQLQVESKLGVGTTFYIELPKLVGVATVIPEGVLLEN